MSTGYCCLLLYLLGVRSPFRFFFFFFLFVLFIINTLQHASIIIIIIIIRYPYISLCDCVWLALDCSAPAVEIEHYTFISLIN